MTSSDSEEHLGMTEEQWAWFQGATSGFGEQDEYGNDLSILRRNLHLTPTERLQRMFRSRLDRDQVRRV